MSQPKGLVMIRNSAWEKPSDHAEGCYLLGNESNLPQISAIYPESSLWCAVFHSSLMGHSKDIRQWRHVSSVNKKNLLSSIVIKGYWHLFSCSLEISRSSFSGPFHIQLVTQIHSQTSTNSGRLTRFHFSQIRYTATFWLDGFVDNYVPD